MNDVLTKCIEETGRELVSNNQDIVKYLCSIQDERNTLDLIIKRQFEERKKIESELEKLTYKLCLINKSMSMRIKAKNNYDKTIDEIRNRYEELVNTSTTLKHKVVKTQQDLDDIMNKRIGTGTGPSGEEIKMLYVKPNERRRGDECSCVYITEVPTKDGPKAMPPATKGEPGNELTSSNEPQSNNNSKTDKHQNPIEHDKTHFSNNTNLHLQYDDNGNQIQLDDNKNQSDTSAKATNQIISSEDIEEKELSLVDLDYEVPKKNQRSTLSNNSVTRIAPTPLAFDDDGSGHDVVDKPGGPLPDIQKINALDDPSTNILLSRLRTSITRSSDEERNRSKLMTPRELPKVVRRSNNVSSFNSTASKDKMQKKSVTDVLKVSLS